MNAVACCLVAWSWETARARAGLSLHKPSPIPSIIANTTHGSIDLRRVWALRAAPSHGIGGSPSAQEVSKTFGTGLVLGRLIGRHAPGTVGGNADSSLMICSNITRSSGRGEE